MHSMHYLIYVCISNDIVICSCLLHAENLVWNPFGILLNPTQIRLYDMIDFRWISFCSDYKYNLILVGFKKIRRTFLRMQGAS